MLYIKQSCSPLSLLELHSWSIYSSTMHTSPCPRLLVARKLKISVRAVWPSLSKKENKEEYKKKKTEGVGVIMEGRAERLRGSERRRRVSNDQNLWSVKVSPSNLETPSLPVSILSAYSQILLIHICEMTRKTKVSAINLSPRRGLQSGFTVLWSLGSHLRHSLAILDNTFIWDYLKKKQTQEQLTEPGLTLIHHNWAQEACALSASSRNQTNAHPLTSGTQFKLQVHRFCHNNRLCIQSNVFRQSNLASCCI